MKNLLGLFVLTLFFAQGLFAQVDSSVSMVNYTHDFRFTDGIFMTFDEFKNNAPSIKEYQLIEEKNSYEKGDFKLRITLSDSAGKTRTRIVHKCFGFSRNGVLYFNNGSSGYYRMFIIGALSHILWYAKYSSGAGDLSPGGIYVSSTIHDFKEYLLDFETGKKFLFNYDNFSDFLKAHDEALYKELVNSKKKKTMIHYFLLKYNEKHPIYFPAG